MTLSCSFFWLYIFLLLTILYVIDINSLFTFGQNIKNSVSHPVGLKCADVWPLAEKRPN